MTNEQVEQYLTELRNRSGLGNRIMGFELPPLLFPQRITKLYHYTTAEGLHGILSNHRLWASSATFLNDSSELEYGLEIFDSVLSEWESLNQSHLEGFVFKVIRQARGMFRSPQVHPLTTVYVACFCEEDNLLSQWRTYGQTGGYSLEFPVQNGTLNVEAENNIFSSTLLRVNYHENDQRSLTHDFVRQVITVLEIGPELIKQNVSDELPLLNLSSFAVFDLIAEHVVGFKNPAFAEEREWRIVLRRNLWDWIQDLADNKPWFKPDFRHSRGILVPYIQLKPASGQNNLPVVSVRFGPSLNKMKAEPSLRTFLTANGYSHAEIRGSNIPVLL